ncbi:BMP-2-inducible protein kinase [Austrofundulus limnaeus]|nr:PREDICTED: BMP-2-inducible protein kinase-like [Austrofundulus limnaeus]
MDSEEEEDEDRQSSDSDFDPSRVRSRSKRPAGRKEPAPRPPGTGLITPPVSPSGAGPSGDVDMFGAIPFLGPETRDIFSKAPFRQVGLERTPTDDLDVFTKAPFSRNRSRSNRDVPAGQTPPVSPEGIDAFGFSPFHPGPDPPATSRSADDICRLEESTNQRLRQRSLQRLSSRQRRTKQEAGGSKRHHGTPTGARKTSKPTYRTPERVRRHKKVGRRDSQSSIEFLSPSDSKENISVDFLSHAKDRAPPPPDDPGLDPFHPQDGGSAKSWAGPLNGGESRTIDDFGAVPFTELVIHSGPQQASQTLDLDPFGAAPFPSKQ